MKKVPGAVSVFHPGASSSIEIPCERNLPVSDPHGSFKLFPERLWRAFRRAHDADRTTLPALDAVGTIPNHSRASSSVANSR